MKNYTRIILILFAALCICSCGIRSQKNASREADTGPVDADYFIELTGHHPGRGETELPGDTSTDGEYDTVGDVSYPPYPSEVVRTEDADIDLFELAREESAGPPIFIVSDMIEIIPDIMEVVSADMVADAMIVGSRPSSRSSSRSASGGVGGHRADIQSRPGTITAGEWNDLDNWSFWQKVSAREEFVRFPGYWEFYCGNRVSVAVESPDGRPVVDAGVRLLRGDAVLYSARTDNRGRVELWVGLTQKNTGVDYGALSLEVDGKIVSRQVKPFGEGINRVTATGKEAADKIDVAFVVDATGSMGDELEYLKTEMVDVIERVEQANPGRRVRTSAVFYRDVGDDYVTRVSDFTDDLRSTADFIREQYASGGGDYPEAVHTALEKATGELQWSDDARTRIMFLLLDAPPHHRTDVIASLHRTVPAAAGMGIKIIPIVASGIDKETEFLMRYFAIATNGTYVFITDHSGVGNAHLEPSVGEYQVEYLNDVMVRLINKYSR